MIRAQSFSFAYWLFNFEVILFAITIASSQIFDPFFQSH